jgi:hypothetical protein
VPCGNGLNSFGRQLGFASPLGEASPCGGRWQGVGNSFLTLARMTAPAGPQNSFQLVKDMLSFTRLNPSVGGTRLERERRGRFLASAASMSNEPCRASHKTDRSRGHEKTSKQRQNHFKQRTDYNSAPLPMWGRVWGYPRSSTPGASRRGLSLKKRSSGVVERHHLFRANNQIRCFF